MPQSRVEIPEISERRLGYLARIIRPVVSLTTAPYGRWPEEEVNTYWLRMPRNLREDNFLKQKSKGRPLRLVKERLITTLHRPGSGGVVFSPTIAEVLAQIPEEYLRKDLPSGYRIIAFETYLENRDPEYNETGEYHKARTALLVQGSPVAGTFRTHYC